MKNSDEKEETSSNASRRVQSRRKQLDISRGNRTYCRPRRNETKGDGHEHQRGKKRERERKKETATTGRGIESGQNLERKKDSVEKRGKGRLRPGASAGGRAKARGKGGSVRGTEERGTGKVEGKGIEQGYPEGAKFLLCSRGDTRLPARRAVISSSRCRGIYTRTHTHTHTPYTYTQKRARS